MKTVLTAGILSFIALYMTSCAPVLYTTVGQNVPLFHKKGEVAISSGFSETNHTVGFNLQLAAAVDSSLEIISSYYSLNNTGMVLSNNTSVRYFELGAGKFRYNPSNKFCGELVAGIGFASIKNSALEFYGSNKVGDVNVNYFKPFIQPSVGISTKLVDFAFTPRIGLVHFTSNPGNVLDSQVKKDLDSFYSDNRKYFRLRTRGYASAGFQTS